MGLDIQEIKENSHEGNGEGAGKSLDAGPTPVDEIEVRKGDRKSLELCSSKTFSAKQMSLLGGAVHPDPEHTFMFLLAVLDCKAYPSSNTELLLQSRRQLSMTR